MILHRPPGPRPPAGGSVAASRARAARPPAGACKGTGARGSISPRFEGGQTPIHRRTPKSKGFNNPFRVEYVVLNLDHLDDFDVGTVVDPGVLRSHGLVAKRGLVKILGRGEVSKALTVRAHAFSQGCDPGDRGRRWKHRDHPRAVG